MKFRYAALMGALAALAMPAQALSQEVLKWAHVYEPNEPFHTESVWAAEEIGKRTDGRYKIDVFPSSQLGKEADINQGLTLGTVDIIVSGSSFAAREFAPIGVTYYPFIFRDATIYSPMSAATSTTNWRKATKRRPATTSRPRPTTARATPPRTGRSQNAPTWPA
jgi:TRAP-type C4-dicarboxylate transport system substrate-binding protein